MKTVFLKFLISCRLYHQMWVLLMCYGVERAAVEGHTSRTLVLWVAKLKPDSFTIKNCNSFLMRVNCETHFNTHALPHPHRTPTPVLLFWCWGLNPGRCSGLHGLTTELPTSSAHIFWSLCLNFSGTGNGAQGLRQAKKHSAVNYVPRPFIFTFYFEARTQFPNLALI